MQVHREQNSQRTNLFLSRLGRRAGAEQRAALNHLRHSIVSNGREASPLKSAWLNVIDQCFTDNPSPKLVFAAMEEVDWLSPTNSKAIGINLI
jgi:hypothetical protein